MPRVSVIMAAYNCQETIGFAIESIINQTMEDWELIIVDDCSTDNTIGVVESYLGDYRLKLIRNKQNLGSGHSRNIAIKTAASTWIAVQDADDLSLPNRLFAQLNAAESTEGATVVASQIAEFGTWGGPEISNWAVTDSEVESRYRNGKMPVPHCSSLINLGAILNAGGYDVDCRRAQDFALYRRMVDPKFVVLSEVSVLYRTVRPLPLDYVIRSGRYGRLARIRTRKINPVPTAQVQSFPWSFLTDARSFITWSRRRLTEKQGGR